MQSIARRSPFGWTLVKGIEDDPEYNKADLGIDSKDVRAYEKVLVSYNNFNFKRPRWGQEEPVEVAAGVEVSLRLPTTALAITARYLGN